MSDAFRSFSTILLEQPIAAPAAEAVRDATPAPNGALAPDATDPRVVDLLDTFVAEVTRLSARVAELLEERAEALLAELARRVLGRELQAAPCDLGILLEDLVTEFAIEPPLAIRVCEADARRWHPSHAVEVDPLLAPGDVVVQVEDGAYDLKLQTRLQGLLAAQRVAL